MSSGPAAPDSRSAPPGIEAGRVGRPHGLDGSFYVTRPRPAMLELGVRVSVAGEQRELVRRSGTDRRPIVRLEGVETRERAESLRAEPLLVPLAQAPALEEGAWWAHELVGLRVSDGQREVGVVRELLELPSCEALVVERPGAGELIVPMVGDAIRALDVKAGTVDVDLAFLGEEGPS